MKKIKNNSHPHSSIIQPPIQCFLRFRGWMRSPWYIENRLICRLGRKGDVWGGNSTCNVPTDICFFWRIIWAFSASFDTALASTCTSFVVQLSRMTISGSFCRWIGLMIGRTELRIIFLDFENDLTMGSEGRWELMRSNIMGYREYGTGYVDRRHEVVSVLIRRLLGWER